MRLKSSHATKVTNQVQDNFIKKLQLDSKPPFKKKGNEKQYILHGQVCDRLVDSVTSMLDQTSPAVEKAKLSSRKKRN